ncbi:hypothetical protein J3F83DRAFT_730116 [Trichoderma novae-zelandiae]
MSLTRFYAIVCMFVCLCTSYVDWSYLCRLLINAGVDIKTCMLVLLIGYKLSCPPSLVLIQSRRPVKASIRRERTRVRKTSKNSLLFLRTPYTDLNMQNLDTPIALRRSRRVNAKSESPPAIPSPPMTPHRRKSGFCCSDPGPPVSSGLTPMIRRTYLAATPKGRRLVNVNLTPSSPTPRSKRRSDAGDVNLHHTIDGRVERRLRRNGLRDMLNRMQQEKRRAEQSAQGQIDRLRAQVQARDREIYELQNATVVMDTERIWGLEQQIRKLRRELAKRSLVKEEVTQYYGWAEPSIEVPRDDEMDMTGDGPRFGRETVVQVKAGSPSRARSSFLTPPPTSPTVPASPCYREASPSPSSRHPQMDIPEPDKQQQLEEEIASLQFKTQRLAAALDSHNALCERISEALSKGPTRGGKAFSSLEAIEHQVQLLLQTVSDQASAATHLTSAISALGFPGDDAREMITSLAAGFRDARLELEYLTPGEITLPLTSRCAGVLDLLLMRLRALTKKSREDDDAIDGYHETEQSLRKELASRTSAIDEFNEELGTVYGMLDEKDERIRELQVGNDRLRSAVDGYIRDIAELRKAVGRLADEQEESTNAHAAQQQLGEESLAANNAAIAELEARVEEEKKKAKAAMMSMKGELQRVLHLSQDFCS